jgi:hypothetical protein
MLPLSTKATNFGLIFHIYKVIPIYPHCMKACGTGSPDNGSKFSLKNPDEDCRKGLAQSPDEEVCDFCPTNVMRYPDRIMIL